MRASEPRRGVKPAFEPHHVIAAILAALRGPIGRPRLSRLLGLGDTAAKTLLRRLRELGVIEPSRRGVMLSSRGATLVSGLSLCLRGKCIGVDIGCEPWCKDVGSLSPLLEFRDELVRLGVPLEVIACCREGFLVPGADAGIASRLAGMCKDCMGRVSTCVVLSREAGLIDACKLIEAVARLLCASHGS